MSKERARRRAEREALEAAARARRAREVARRARRRAFAAAVRRPFTVLAVRGPGRSRPDSALRRHRSRQNGLLAAGLLALNGVVWLLDPSWLVRGAAAAATLLAWPLLLVLAFDRHR